MASTKKRFYITTPIYYPSGNAHIGHAYCTTLCDVFARYKRMRHFETYFLTGTDEHGLKIEKNAKAANLTPKEYVDGIVAKFKDLWKVMEISNDGFIRTTDPKHINVVQHVFSHMIKNDDLYLGSYEGWYCVPCESFWSDAQVGEEHLCPDCGRPVEKQEETCLFFKTQKYLPDLMEKFFDKDKTITPEGRKTEMLNNFINPGLSDLCVSRSSFKWGISIKEYENHVSYVWVDALFNYVSALGYLSEDDSLFKKFWEDENSEIIHVIGADITRFHTIYRPEFLLSMGLRLPDRVFVHGLLMMKDGKMSKSKGNVVSPYPLIEKYGVDALRYYLVREIIFGSNGQFTPEQFIDRINMDLVNSYGNLVSRSISMVVKYFGGVIPSYKKNINKEDNEIDSLIDLTIKKFIDELDDLKITEGYIDVMNLIYRANKYIEETLPWALAKDEVKKENLESVMVHLCRVIFVSTKLLEPVLVNKSKEVYKQLGLLLEEADFDNIYNEHLLDNKKVNKGEILFPRLDVNKEVEYVKSLMSSK